MSEKPKRSIKYFRLQSSEELRQNIKRARELTGLSSASEVVRFAVKQLVASRGEKQVA